MGLRPPKAAYPDTTTLRTLGLPLSFCAMRVRNAAKWSLIILSVPAWLLCLMYLQVGLTFGFNLWRADRPFAIAFWFAVVLFPFLLFVAIRSTKHPLRFWTLAITAWVFLAFWVFHQFIWMPWTFGGPWGW
jgi:hypothetical protein